MRLFHIARTADWEAARATGRYTAEHAATTPERTSGTPSFSRLFLEEILFRTMIGLGVMALAGAAGLAAQLLYGDAVALPVTLLTLVIALLGAVVLTRRRDRALRRQLTRPAPPPPRRSPTRG